MHSIQTKFIAVLKLPENKKIMFMTFESPTSKTKRNIQRISRCCDVQRMERNE